MNIIQKQSLSSTLISYIGIGVSYVNLIFILPHFLTLEQIGLIRLIVEIGTMLMLVFQFGTPYLIIRFFPDYLNSDLHQRSFYTLGLMFSFIGISLMLIFYFLFQDAILGYFSTKSPFIHDYQLAFLAIAGSLIVFQFLDRVFATRKKVVISFFFREFVFRAGLTVLAVITGIGLVNFSTGVNLWVSIYLMSPIILLGMFKIKFGLRFAFDRKVWNYSNYKKFLSYTAIVTMGAIGGGLSLKIDMLMTGSMLGLEQLGIYATMVYIATVIEIPKRSLIQISDPFISEYHASNDLNKIGSLYRNSSSTMLVFGVFIFLIIYSNLNYLFMIMPKGELFSVGINVFLIIGMVKLSTLVMGIGNQILLNSSAAWISSATVIILAIMAIGFNYLLIPIYGIEGAALATLIAVGVNNALIIFNIYYRFKIHPFCKEIFMIITIGLILFALIKILPAYTNPYIGIFFTTLVIALVYPFLIYKLNISPDANLMAIQMWGKAKKILRMN